MQSVFTRASMFNPRTPHPRCLPSCLSLSLFPGTHSIRIDGDMLAGMRYITPCLLFLAMTTGGQMTRHHKRDRGRQHVFPCASLSARRRPTSMRRNK